MASKGKGYIEVIDRTLAATGTLDEQMVEVEALTPRFDKNLSPNLNENPNEKLDENIQNFNPLRPYSSSRRPIKSCARRVVPLAERIGWWFSVGACASALWMLALESAQIESANRGIAALSTELQSIQQKNASLGALIDSSSNPNRILQYASKFGMHQSIPIVITERG